MGAMSVFLLVFAVTRRHGAAPHSVIVGDVDGKAVAAAGAGFGHHALGPKWIHEPTYPPTARCRATNSSPSVMRFTVPSVIPSREARKQMAPIRASTTASAQRLRRMQPRASAPVSVLARRTWAL